MMSRSLVVVVGGGMVGVWLWATGCTSPAPAQDDDGILAGASAGSGGSGGTGTTTGMGGTVASSGGAGPTATSGTGSTTTSTSATTSTTSTTTGGSGDPCVDACLQDHAAGVADLTALFQCSICRNCASPCDGPNDPLCQNIATSDTCGNGDPPSSVNCNSCLNSNCTQTACATEQNQCFSVNPECDALNACLAGC